MIHAGALPGTPAGRQSVDELTESAVREAEAYRAGGVDGVMIENMHDLPYLKGAVGPEVVAALSVIGQAVKAESGLPVGIQILAAANIESMAVAHAAGLDFIRAEGYAFAHIADEGLIEAQAWTRIISPAFTPLPTASSSARTSKQKGTGPTALTRNA